MEIPCGLVEEPDNVRKSVETMSKKNSVVNYQWEYKSLKHDTSIMGYEKGMNDLSREGKNGWELVSTVLTDSPTNPDTQYLSHYLKRKTGMFVIDLEEG